jgi:DNA polymerase (family 10)
MKRADLCRILRETAALLEFEGENPFRVRAYLNAARTFEGLVEEPQELLEQGRLAELPGVGPGLVAAVAEIVQTGRLTAHDRLHEKYPLVMLELFRIPGVGAKRIRTLVRELGVTSPAELERACLDGRVAPLAGFGAKTEAKILEGVRQLGRYQERHLLDEASTLAEALLAHLRDQPAVEAAEIAGSLRRKRETIGNLDFVAAVPAARRDEVADRFAAAPSVLGVESRDAEHVRLRLADGYRADLRLVERAELAPALRHFTGSVEHDGLLRAHAARLGLTLGERGLFEGERRLEVADERELFARLGLAWIEPELREGLDEIERAARGELPELVTTERLRGTFHVHTTWSDGTASVAQMAAAAARHGWEYLGIADHSQLAAYAGGLSPERVREQWREIDEWNARGERPFLFKGTECDVLVDGALDFPDELLLGFDFVVVSVHSRFRIGREAMTARLVRAVSHPAVTFLGHPTGRLLLAREGYEVDLDAVLEAAHANGVVVEVNASPHRLDLDWRALRGWLARGDRTSIHPDAHSQQGLADVRWGVAVARKAGARPADVLGCDPLDEVSRFFAARRERARRRLGSAG